MTDRTNANRKIVLKFNQKITMKNMALSILTFLPSTVSHGQISDIKEKPKLIEHNIYPPNVKPEIYISIDTFKIKLDSVSLKLINPQWLRKAEVIKSEKKKKIFGNTNPTVVIYSNRKFKQEILIILKNKIQN
jgi:hypothetical protein